MILFITFLSLLFKYAYCEDFEFHSNERIVPIRYLRENKHKPRVSLRINYYGRQNDDHKYDHVSNDLIHFLDCLGDAPSHIPPITLGEYKEIVQSCLSHGNSLDNLRKKSKEALEKPVPKEARPLFECFSEMEKEDSDEHHHSAQIITCLNNGDPRKALIKLRPEMAEGKKSTPSKTNEQFANAFQKCILKSERDSYEGKVLDCMDNFKDNDERFYKHYSKRKVIRSHEGDEKLKEHDDRANTTKKPEILAIIIVDDDKKNGKRNHIFIPKSKHASEGVYKIM